MAIRSDWSRHDRCCWGRTGFQQLGGGAGRAGTCVVYRPLLAGSGARFRVRGSERVPRPLLTNRCQLFKRRLAVRLLDRNSHLKTLRVGERRRGATIKLAAGSVHQALRTTQQVVRADQRPSALLNQLVLEICGRVPARASGDSCSRACRSPCSDGSADQRLSVANGVRWVVTSDTAGYADWCAVAKPIVSTDLGPPQRSAAGRPGSPQKVKPDDGAAAVAADSLPRFCSRGFS